jgi:hypothetical protein
MTPPKASCYAGNFPLRLVPEQVRVLTLNDGERLVTYAKEIIQQLRAEQVRVESDLGSAPINDKIAEAEKAHGRRLTPMPAAAERVSSFTDFENVPS